MKQSFKYGLSNAHIFLNQINLKQSIKNEQSTQQHKQQNKESSTHKSFVSDQTFKDKLQNPKAKITLTEIIINKYLEQTQVKYQKDLEQLEQNRDNLLQAIEILGQKLQVINELETKNNNYEKVIAKKRQKMSDLILEHQKISRELFNMKIFLKQQYKIACLSLRALMAQCQSDSRFQKYCEQWDRHSLQLQKSQLFAQKSDIMKNHSKIMHIFKKKQEFQYQKSIQQQIVLTKKPSKKVESSQKAQLLGNLKQFSKKFKIP